MQLITEESQFQIRDARDKVQREVNMLRMNLASRDEELERLKVLKRLEVERAREEGYDRAEKRLLAQLRAREARFAEEREALGGQLELAAREGTERYARL